MVEHLLRNDANPGIRDNQGYNAVHYAALIGHKGAGYLITNEPEGAEYTINLAAICVVFALIGPRAYSLDALIF